MAHSLVHHNKTIKRSDSRKSHSWWWDSHITPKNSKWLIDNLEEMDQSVKTMLKLIEEDADSFAKKAEMYYQKRPVLISHVEEFYRLYRSLAERYDYLTGELRKNISSDLQSQSSGVSDIVSEPSSAYPFPDHLIGQRKSSNRAAGFDFFLGSGGSNSDTYQKEGDESSSLTDSEPESDDSSVKNYAVVNDGDQRLNRKMIELKIELREVKEKLLMKKEENGEGSIRETRSEKSEDLLARTVGYEEELRIDRGGSFKELTEELKIAKERLKDSEKEINRLKLEIEENKSFIKDEKLQDELELAKKETAIWKAKLNTEKREVSKLHERITRLKTSLSDREHEIRDLKTAVSDAEQKIFPEKAQVKAEISRLSEEENLLKEQLREWESHARSWEEEIRKLKNEKAGVEGRMNMNIVKLEAEVSDKSERIKNLEKSSHALNSEREKMKEEVGRKTEQMDEMGENLKQVMKQREELGSELRWRVEEMEEEIEKRGVAIKEGAEEKREAIRQLCFSLEHYRNDYLVLRRALVGHKRVADFCGRGVCFCVS